MNEDVSRPLGGRTTAGSATSTDPISIDPASVEALLASALALEYEANHDSVTGLPNRRLFVEALEASLERTAGSGRHTGAVFVSLDGFKTINDRFGHVDGDEVLRAVGELFEGLVDDGDTVARFGGDVFVVCMDDVAGPDELLARVTRLQFCLRAPFRVRSQSHTLSASIGMALSTSGTGAETLLRNADVAMHAAKQAGGSRAELFDEGLYAALQHHQELSAEIAAAIDNGEFKTHFQPEVALRTGTLVGFEALARWDHPKRGWLGPSEFLDIAEMSGTISELGRQVLADGCQALASWLDRAPEQHLSVAVNVSPFQLADPGFPSDVRSAIREAGVPAGRVCLEVTESSLMDPDAAAEALRNLKAIGVTIAIDDFGTGYSSLARLKRFPVDLLKIDRSFVAGLGSDPEDEVIVATVVNLARSLGIDVIAEGVESQEQLEILASYGCELAQGFLWSPALPPDEAASYAASDEPLRHATTAPSAPTTLVPQRVEATNTIALLVHELATPITVIGGYADLARHLPGPEDTTLLDTALGAIERAAADMTEILSAMADTRALDEGTLSLDRHPVDVPDLLSETVAERSMANGRNPITLAPCDPVCGLIDAAWTRQIFTNLLSNAETWSPPSTPIEIHIEPTERTILVSVIDRGPGVAADRIGDLFRKFSRPDRSNKGTGLGLYVARKLARAQGGDIRYLRADSGGSQFVVELPRA
ncbi:MAG: sensor-containing diguanylate cyclase/phosphodiesterase [Ilumatobacteraceae bacterium]|nr:sensor-containing diguanylate cyclase/phosphodiesterase [Ilumatobacteraceae bacterium]